MTLGPVQLLVLGFDHPNPNFQGELLGELRRLRRDDRVRVIDALVVYKAAGGEVATLKGSHLSGEEVVGFGAVVGALIGLGAGAGAEAGAERAVEQGGVFGDDAWDALAEIPEESAAALVLLEHRWAVPVCDAVVRAGGVRLASEFVSPLDLVAVGLVSAQEAEGLAAANRDAL